MSDEPLGPIEPRKMRFPVPPVCTAQWDDEAWQKWIEAHGQLEPLVIQTAIGVRHAVGRNPKGELVYRLNTEGEV